tara:strand:- start:22 stop:603 length:582 start_codon:yes stop_codon:yes gene_type:complete
MAEQNTTTKNIVKCYRRTAKDGHKYTTCAKDGKQVRSEKQKATNAIEAIREVKEMKGSPKLKKQFIERVNAEIERELPDDVLQNIKGFAKPLPKGKVRNKVSTWKKADYDKFFDYIMDGDFGEYMSMVFHDNTGDELLDRNGDINTRLYDRAYNKHLNATQKNVNAYIRKNKKSLDGKTTDEIVMFVDKEFKM